MGQTGALSCAAELGGLATSPRVQLLAPAACHHNIIPGQCSVDTSHTSCCNPMQQLCQHTPFTPPPPRRLPQLDFGQLDDVGSINRQQLAAVKQRLVAALGSPKRVLLRDKLSFMIGCCQVW
jgi:hypothetical protein